MHQPAISAENVGLLTHGNVHAQTLVLNVGGQPHPLCEISSDQVRDLRQVVMKVIACRTKLALIPRIVTGALIFWPWWNIPAALSRGIGLSQAELWFAGMLMGGCSVVSAWLIVYPNMGAWARRHRNAIPQLETNLSKIDAELDIHKLASEFGNAAMLRALFAPMRIDSFNRRKGGG